MRSVAPWRELPSPMHTASFLRRLLPVILAALGLVALASAVESAPGQWFFSFRVSFTPPEYSVRNNLSESRVLFKVGGFPLLLSFIPATIRCGLLLDLPAA